MHQLPDGSWSFTFGGDCRCSYHWPTLTQVSSGGWSPPRKSEPPIVDASQCPLHGGGELLASEIEAFLNSEQR